MRPILVLLALALLSACQRPSQEECERLCWRYSELQYWQAFEQQAQDLSEADRATLRAERQAEWEELKKQPKNPGRDNCITACKKSGKKAQVKCVEAASTAAAATACIESE